MKKVLIVGEHPYGITGNSHMMNALLQQIPMDQHDITVFSSTFVGQPFIAPYKFVDGGANPYDEMGGAQLINFLNKNPTDILCFIGVDLWKYSKIFHHLLELKKQQRFIIAAIFPYDAYYVRNDWLEMFQHVEIPCVYSDYGYNLLNDKLPLLYYFRPPLYDADKYVPYTQEQKTIARKNLFHEYVNDENFVFGFFGHNQFRKDPLRVIKAFFELKRTNPNLVLYLHTDIKEGVFNIEDYIRECGGQLGDVMIKRQNFSYSTEAMVEAYNSVDCIINTSLQEGLSWTLLEAMLCGIPVIAAGNTAQQEILSTGAGIGVPSSETAFLPVLTSKGNTTFIESKACHFPSLLYVMRIVLNEPTIRKNLSERGMKKAKEWVEGAHDIKNMLQLAYQYKPPQQQEQVQLSVEKVEAVLFAQHSSAGDVFMTTRCFEDLNKRHPDLPFIYMTQKKYQDIIEGNPYVDQIIDWDEKKLKGYKIVYNPHGEKILPGHWGRNSNSQLGDFYWKVLMIEKPGDFFIELKKPIDEVCKAILGQRKKICVLHTTGGDPAYRTYKYMTDVAKELKDRYLTVQLGGKDDYPAQAEVDLRGKLSFRETAWVVTHADVAVTVDSFISHLCGALGVSQVCLFGSGNANVVAPIQIGGTCIRMSPDYIRYCPGLGPCSAAVRDCPVHCTGVHDPKTILEDIKKLEESL